MVFLQLISNIFIIKKKQISEINDQRIKQKYSSTKQ